MSPLIEAIRETIESSHGCIATHATSTPVHLTRGKEVVWDGIVEIFNLSGHAPANRCFAWKVRNNDPDLRAGETIIVLASPTVSDPQTAVRWDLAPSGFPEDSAPPSVTHVISHVSQIKLKRRPPGITVINGQGVPRLSPAELAALFLGKSAPSSRSLVRLTVYWTALHALKDDSFITNPAHALLLADLKSLAAQNASYADPEMDAAAYALVTPLVSRTIYHAEAILALPETSATSALICRELIANLKAIQKHI